MFYKTVEIYGLNIFYREAGGSSVAWRSVVKVLITALALVTLIASPTFARPLDRPSGNSSSTRTTAALRTWPRSIQYPGESGQKDYNKGYPVYHCWDDVRCSAR